MVSVSAWWDPEGLFLHPEQRPGFLSLWEILDFIVGLEPGTNGHFATGIVGLC